MLKLILKLSLCNKANFFFNLLYRMKHNHHKKSHSHSHYLLNIFSNYLNDLNKSFDEFVHQYLTIEGRVLLSKFNKFMIIAIFLNVEIYLSVYAIISILLLVKVFKIRQHLPSNNQNNLFSINMIRQKIEKLSRKIRKLKIQSNQKSNQQHSQDLELMVSTSNTNSNQQQNRIKIMINLTQEELQKKICLIVGQLANSYAKFISFVKLKGILLLIGIVVIVYLLQPQFKSDTFRVRARASQKGVQIQSIKHSSYYVNQFYLVFFTLLSNAVIFFIYGTQTLKKQLVQQLYDVQKAKQKSNKLKVNRNLSFEQSSQLFLQKNIKKCSVLSRSMSYIENQNALIKQNQSSFDLQLKLNLSPKHQTKLKQLKSFKENINSIEQNQSPSPFYTFSNRAKQTFNDIRISDNGINQISQIKQKKDIPLDIPSLKKHFSYQSRANRQQQIQQQISLSHFKLELKKVQVEIKQKKQQSIHGVKRNSKPNKIKNFQSFIK